MIGLLNAALEGRDVSSALVLGAGAPPRLTWGCSIGYADIYTRGALVELTGKGIGPAPEPPLARISSRIWSNPIFILWRFTWMMRMSIFSRDFFYYDAELT